MDRDTILRYGAMDGSRPRLDWPPDDDEERDLLFLLDSLSLSLSPLSLSSGEKKKRRKFGLLEEQEKFVNFCSSCRRTGVLFSLYQGLVVDRRRH